jgi:chromosome segregation ATPase
MDSPAARLPQSQSQSQSQRDRPPQAPRGEPAEELVDARRQLAAARSDQGALEDALRLLERENAEATKAKRAASQQLAEASKQLEARSAECESLRRQLSDAAASAPPQTTDRELALGTRIRELEAALKVAQKEAADRVAAAVAKAADEVEATKAAAQNRITTLERRVAEVEAAQRPASPPAGTSDTVPSEALLQELKDTKRELNQALLARDAARKMSSNDHTALNQAKKRIAQLEGELAAAASAGPAGPLPETLPPAAEGEALNRAGEALRNETARAETLQAQIEDLSRTAREAQASATKAEEEANHWREEARRGTEEAAKVRATTAEEQERQLTDAREELARVQASNTSASAKVARLEQELLEVKDSFRQASESATGWKAHADSLQSKLDVAVAEAANAKAAADRAASDQAASAGGSEDIASALTEVTAERDAKAAQAKQLRDQLDRNAVNTRELTTELESKTETLRARESALASAQTQLAEALSRVSDLERRLSSDVSTRSHTAKAQEVASATITELQAELTTLRDRGTAIFTKCTDACSRFDAPARRSASGGVRSPSPAPEAKPADAATAAVEKLVDAFVEVHAALGDSKRALDQWETTYVQARDVNNALKQQLDAARAELKNVRDEAALKQASLDRVAGSTQQQSARVGELQLEVNRLHERAEDDRRAAEDLRQEVETLQRRLDDARAAESAAHGQASALRQQQDEHDAELHEARESIGNMERVLAAYQAQKERDLDEKTRYLAYELDEVKAQLLQQKDAVGTVKADADAQVRAARRDIAAKNNTINSLQGKLGDLRQALEQTMLKMNDANMIDKRIVSHLLVNYVSSVRERRGDDGDIIRVMSGLLNWDAEAMQRVGLVDPDASDDNVPRGPGGSVVLGWGRNLLSGVGGRILGTPARGGARPVGAPSPGGAGSGKTAGGKGNLAQMWVEFLLKEADAGGGEPSSAAAAADAPPVSGRATPGTQTPLRQSSNPDLSQPDLPTWDAGRAADLPPPVPR